MERCAQRVGDCAEGPGLIPMARENRRCAILGSVQVQSVQIQSVQVQSVQVQSVQVQSVQVERSNPMVPVEFCFFLICFYWRYGDGGVYEIAGVGGGLGLFEFAYGCEGGLKVGFTILLLCCVMLMQPYSLGYSYYDECL